MTFNVPTLIGLAGLGAIILGIARKSFQFLELLIKAILLVYRQSGEEVPTWFANQYKQINGNASASKEEKADILGPHHASGQHKTAAVGKEE